MTEEVGVIEEEPKRGRGRPKGTFKKFGRPSPINEELKTNYVVKTAIARLDNKPNKGGRKKRYTPITMRNKINKYFSWCENNDRVPSIKGLTIYLKMYRDQFYQYLAYPEFTDIMEQARLAISEWVENDIYRTPGQAAGKIAYAKNVQGWTDKLETNNTTEIRNISVDEARARIEMLAPQLMELLKSELLVKQLGHDSSNKVIDVTEV